VQSDEAGPGSDRRALIVSGVFRSINEGHRRRLAAKDASVAVSVEIKAQLHDEKPQRLKVFQLDSRRISHQSNKNRETGVNSVVKRLGLVIADVVSGLLAQHGSGMPVMDWARLLRCTECGARDADFVMTGERR
jgi:hypothetical protein